MTRTHSSAPAWEWRCDRCGRHGGEIAREQRFLPTADEMRSRGWFIAEDWGDLCSRCNPAMGGPV